MEKVLIGLVAFLLISACGYNNLKAKEEQTNRAWNDLGFSCRQRVELAAVYIEALQRHISPQNDVVQQAEKTVKKAAREGCPITPPETSERLLKFRQVQTELSETLTRLHIFSSSQPSLLQDDSYLAIQKRMEKAESRLNEAIADYNFASHDFNISKRSFPHSMTNALLLRYRDKEPFVAGEDVKLLGRLDS
ncbi:LemA family lipoprotein [Geotalea daltonii FRC-32]|uniref:LemA family lipoprotein n=2 Tax=Geotalea TaxID=2910589 RepID=B9M5S7_GEODF|nr:LemA family lipoprotein [Geotalea daltonii FRC-32]